MDIFNQREKGFEAKFTLDQEVSFKIAMLRDKLVGLWAAECFGLSGDEAEDYARRLADVGVERSGISGVIEQLAVDFGARQIAISDQELLNALNRQEAVARASILGSA